MIDGSRGQVRRRYEGRRAVIKMFIIDSRLCI